MNNNLPNTNRQESDSPWKEWISFSEFINRIKPVTPTAGLTDRKAVVFTDAGVENPPILATIRDRLKIEMDPVATNEKLIASLANLVVGIPKDGGSYPLITSRSDVNVPAPAEIQEAAKLFLNA